MYSPSAPAAASSSSSPPLIINSSDNLNSQQKAATGGYIASDGFWDRITDERVNEFYLLQGGPSHIIAVVSVYLYFVLWLGPRLMAKRAQPFKLNKLLLFYNMGMTLANLWLFIQGLLVSNYGLDTWGCGKFGGDIRQSPRRGIYLGYLFFLTKLIELLDTVFFVLRKKKEQVTFLHVFHHSIVPIFCWIGIKLAPGGPNGFFPLVNSFIHVIMYSYYALTTFGPRVQPYLWWKKYLTRLQMIQFVLVMINATKTFMSQDCKFPILFSYLQAAVACAFLVLFAMFYRDAYYKKQTRRAVAEKKLNSEAKTTCVAELATKARCNGNKTITPTPTSASASASATISSSNELANGRAMAAMYCGQTVRRVNGAAKMAVDLKTV